MKDNMSSVYSFADNAEMGDGNIKAGGGGKARLLSAEIFG